MEIGRIYSNLLDRLLTVSRQKQSACCVNWLVSRSVTGDYR